MFSVLFRMLKSLIYQWFWGFILDRVWSCGGECMARNDTYPGEFMAKVCDFNRRFVHHLLIEELRNTVYEETGLTLEEYVNE